MFNATKRLEDKSTFLLSVPKESHRMHPIHLRSNDFNYSLYCNQNVYIETNIITIFNETIMLIMLDAQVH